ncbi:MAG: hypothetical protein HYY37_02175 [Candidatus Aenigmarchaeota archaeon]|nr:hypothetical protein [Candidatus Aenigmarchaeota archaeon]
MRNPYAAAFLNLVFYGLGYLYNGNRPVMAAGLILIGIIEIVSLNFNPMSLVKAWTSFPGLLFGLVFAVDGYMDAAAINRQGSR